MSIAKDIGPDLDLLADGPLDGKTASIDDGVHVFDVDAMSGEVTDGPDAGIRCHGAIVFCCPMLEAALMEPIAVPFGSGAGLRSYCVEKHGIV